MNFMPRPERDPTPREKAYLSALEAGELRPSISGQAGHMCRKFGWCEAVYRLPDGSELRRSDLPAQMDSIAIVKAGYRAIGYCLTARGRVALAKG
ncbi:hypothetical protein GCM10007874_16580 [Labrys miyagiensis]|uniref:Uncharacterized protein n=1 Tax=Labrys miyagiensis TaxID=346912 RepID=A0ABQ6CE48_9HYPH|nr:hypothetical protein [Labrys miyagiensis]GLS18641.1 hypothetical protein GCM10007874_16580 [Labrys miyagiensis]